MKSYWSFSQFLSDYHHRHANICRHWQLCTHSKPSTVLFNLLKLIHVSDAIHEIYYVRYLIFFFAGWTYTLLRVTQYIHCSIMCALFFPFIYVLMKMKSYVFLFTCRQTKSNDACSFIYCYRRCCCCCCCCFELIFIILHAVRAFIDVDDDDLWDSCRTTNLNNAYFFSCSLII